jgi:hypothetical protein
VRDTIVKLTAQECLELQGIVMDGDAAQALNFARLVLERVKAAEQSRLKPHLDA